MNLSRFLLLSALMVACGGCPGVRGVVEDGDEDDGTSTAEAADTTSDGLESNQYRMFVTSTSYDGDLVAQAPGAPADGVEAGDNICQAHADAEGFTRTYRAIISMTGDNVKDRLTITGEVYIFSNAFTSVKVADDANQLFNGASTVLDSAPNYDEQYNVVNTYTWTGTNDDGNNGQNCSNWTQDSMPASGEHGDTTKADENWIEDTPLSIFCSGNYPIYCISQGHE